MSAPVRRGQRVTGSEGGNLLTSRLGGALYALSALVALNSLLGPGLLGVVDYPFSQTLRNQTIGLELFSLLVVAPLCLWAGVRLRGGDRLGALWALGPAGYVAYMFVQYVIGPQYEMYPGVLGLHLVIFVLAGAVLLGSWQVSRGALAGRDPGRGWGWALLALTVLLVSRYLAAFVGMAAGAAVPAEFAGDVSMYWTIFLLDLGVVLPAGLACVVALRSGIGWGRTGLYALVGWYALVPPSVLLMALTMVVRNDPFGDRGQVVLFAVLSVLYVAVAAHLFWPLRTRSAPEPPR